MQLNAYPWNGYRQRGANDHISFTLLAHHSKMSWNNDDNDNDVYDAITAAQATMKTQFTWTSNSPASCLQST